MILAGDWNDGLNNLGKKGIGESVWLGWFLFSTIILFAPIIENRDRRFYEKLIELEPKNINALQKLATFRESIGDYKMAFEYIEKLKEIDPRNQFVSDNFEAYKDRAENGGSFISFFKSIFGKRM